MKYLINACLSKPCNVQLIDTVITRFNGRWKHVSLLSLVIGASLLTAACSAANEASATKAAPLTLNEKIQAVDSEVNDMASDTYCEIASDCAILGMGERACGGPSSYKIYSKLIGEEAVSKLQALAAESTALAKKANQKSGLLSTCEIYPLPSPSCIENQCVQTKSAHQTY